MVQRNAKGALTAFEKKIVKGFLARGWRNQDIQALVNLRRNATINSARITEVKQSVKIKPASNNDLDFYIARKDSYDPQTGLNFYDDERLIRARESMIVAVQIFNSPTLKFKTEIFAVLVNIAWTYLLHEHYHRKGQPIIQDDGRSLLLSQMTRRADCPLSQGIKDNIESLKEIRDAVEHTLLRKSDNNWLQLFQANCLNFEKTLCDLFGKKTSLSNELSFSLQFSKLSFEQIVEVQKYDIPEGIEALDRNISERLGKERLKDIEYSFSVYYGFVNSPQSKSHIQFFRPEDVQGQEITNVLVKHEVADERWPYKPGKVCELIRQKSGKPFIVRNHTQAWRKFKARPIAGSQQPDNTNKDFCHYHLAHKDYTYSEKWIDYIVEYISDVQNYNELKSYKL